MQGQRQHAEQARPAAGEPRDQVDALLTAIGAVGVGQDLDAVLCQIVATAVQRADARYGALGVTGEDGRLAGLVSTSPDGSAQEAAQAAEIVRWAGASGLLGQRAARQLWLPDLSALAADRAAGPRPVRSFLGAPVRIGGEVYGVLFLLDKRDGGRFGPEDEALLAALAGAATVAVDHDRLYAEAARQQQWAQANAEVTQRLLAHDEPTGVLDMVARRALQISGADIVWIALPAAGGEVLVIEHAAGLGAARALGVTSPASRSAAGRVMATGEPLASADWSSDERIWPLARQRMHLGPVVMVPLGPPGEVRGVLGAGRRCGAAALPPASVQMVMTFAAQAGIGVELAERREAEQRVALLADRDRIARDLHDQVIQRLFATGMALQGATSLIPGTEAADRVQQAVDDLDQVIGDIRAAIFTLQSRAEPGRPGVQARIVAITQEMTAAAGFAPWLRMDGRLDARVPAEVAEELLAALREALANAARHSGATQVLVTVETGRQLVLTVRDNGTGIGEAGRRGGLANLAERAGGLGGTLRVTTPDGGGTELAWSVPLAAPRPRAAGA